MVEDTLREQGYAEKGHAKKGHAEKGESIRLTGVVQGVGMRPKIWQIARLCGVRGEVRNDNRGVLIHLWGNRAQLETFKTRLKNDMPPLSRVDNFVCSPLPGKPFNRPDGFVITQSEDSGGQTAIAADTATCSDCLKELWDPENRRYRYPFINCTHCGPRFSIVKSMPLDRENTVMDQFKNCLQCESEYRNPADRRFHMQGICCDQCGPRLSLQDATGKTVLPAANQDLIQHCATLIRQGKIVAIKGIGGIHLACDACQPQAVSALRKRKRRDKKAFAMMARDIKMIEGYAELNEREAKQLSDPAAPIVVLRRAMFGKDVRGKDVPGKDVPGKHSRVADQVAPSTNTLGFMLPYTPLHHLLMRALDSPIVLTSGNLSDDAQCADNAEAMEKLATIADYFLLHDRPIENRLDDSVLRVYKGEPFFIRRARGYTQNIPVSKCAAETATENAGILAMGAELKSTFCMLGKKTAMVSQHFGDLGNAACLQGYRANLRRYEKRYHFLPERIAVDKHPEYLSTKIGRALSVERNIKLVEVQHHHAHIASCMAEHGLTPAQGPVLGIAMDGLGYGDKNAFWGAEFLLTDYKSIERLAHFQDMAMPGGTMAIRQPWRNTFACFHDLGWAQIEKEFPDLDLIRFLQAQPLDTMQTLLKRGIHSPMASSAGRLFDAVGAALGICREKAHYEGQVGIELEAMAEEYFVREATNAYAFDFSNRQICWQPMWHGLLRDLSNGDPPQLIASRFHHALINAITEIAITLCQEQTITTVVLSGGVFQNQLLLSGCDERLQAHSLQVLIPRVLPINDAGISFGQAIVASHQSADEL